jgi:hypothetical protein
MLGPEEDTMALHVIERLRDVFHLPAHLGTRSRASTPAAGASPPAAERAPAEARRACGEFPDDEIEAHVEQMPS